METLLTRPIATETKVVLLNGLKGMETLNRDSLVSITLSYY